MKKPEGLDSGIALREYAVASGLPRPETPASRLQRQLILNDLVLSGAVSLEQARELGYAGEAQRDLMYSALLTLRDIMTDAVGYPATVPMGQVRDAARALVEAGWTPPEDLIP